LLEDELWTRIRLAPETLPKGEIDLVPGLQFLRLGHSSLKPEKAMITLSSTPDLRVLSIDYKSLKRRLVISFEKAFPYSILRWEETAPGGFDPGSPLLTTRAVRKKVLLLDYWNKHKVSDSFYRERLGLTQK
jgi:hypothetical protein